MSPESRSLAFYLSGESQNDNDIYVFINSYWEDLRFGIFQGQPGEWRQIVNTAAESPHDINDDGPVVNSRFIDVAARSVIVLI